jgi:hypothetical protein
MLAAMNNGHGRGDILRTAMTIDPVIHASLVGFGFVYIHPFADGNGRMHRFILQQILARRGFSPTDFIIPVSPAILRDRVGYLNTLATFSNQIMPHIQYTRNQKTGKVTVKQHAVDLYRYPDLTAHAEFLYEKIDDALERDVHSELIYLQTYDRAKLRLQLVKDLPDHQMQVFLRLCFSSGALTDHLRQQHFPDIDTSVINAMEQTVLQTIAECPLPQAFIMAQALEQ